jgi:endonuclease/exonuclease/phosphatase family metal-dependent hydrolase
MSTMASTGSETVVATANILRTLRRGEARAAVEAVLATGPDIVGLQEWGWSRRTLLPRTDMSWFTPLYGGNPVGVRRDRFEPLSVRRPSLGWVARSDRGARPVPVLPPRFATVVTLRDRLLDRPVTVVNYHLVPGVQSQGVYREDRPLLTARHATEVSRLRDLVAELVTSGTVTFAMGDSNFHGLRLTPLTSAWHGREGGPGTLGSHRKIDDVFGPGPATTVTLVTTASDHRAVVTRRPDFL